MTRKVALLACRDGKWVHVGGISPLYLKADVHRDTAIEVELSLDTQRTLKMCFVGPGIHSLDDATWAKARIIDGQHEDALCLFQGGAVALSRT